MKLATMELADHTAAARRFKSKFFLAKDWDLTADFQARVVWVTGKDAQGKQGRWWFPFEQVVYGEPVEMVEGTTGSEYLPGSLCGSCGFNAKDARGLAAHVRSKHPG